MKKIINYYFVFLLLFLLLFFYLESNQYYFKGILYHFIMITIIVFSFCVINKYNESLKFKKIFYLFIPVCALIIDNPYLYIMLIILFFEILAFNYRQKFISIIFGIVSLICVLFSPLVILLTLTRIDMINGEGNRLRSMAYDEEHYKCGEYEIFWYSGGAMDHMHYAVLKTKSVIKVGNIIDIGYDKQIGYTLEEYNKILSAKQCEGVK